MREREAAAAGGAGGGAPRTGASGGAAGGGPAAATTTGPAPVEPRPWAPPGDQPIPFYIGNEAHNAIARNYIAAHENDTVFANNISLTRIFRDLTRLGRTSNTGALNDGELALMPDIVNLTRLHLYEIKPLAAQRLGAARARMYWDNRSWLYPTARHEPFLHAALAAWDELDAVGARYYVAVQGERLWSTPNNLHYVLGNMGVPNELLRAPLPPEGPRALLRYIKPPN